MKQNARKNRQRRKLARRRRLMRVHAQWTLHGMKRPTRREWRQFMFKLIELRPRRRLTNAQSREFLRHLLDPKVVILR